MMQSNRGKPEAAGHRASSVRSAVETKQIPKVNRRKVLYRVGYSWNKGGRLKELRIRHLARKFLNIWMQNTFGRVSPHKAKCHNDRAVLRRAFEGWRDEWWVSRREWSLATRAECHYRYYLYNLVFHSWHTFTSLRREKKSRRKIAESHADRQRMVLVWDRWEVSTELRRMKRRMLESAFEQKRFATLHFAWSTWQKRLRRHQHLYTLEGQVHQQQALTLQRRVWLQWKERHTAVCFEKEKESKASLHYTLRLKSKTLCQWMSYVSRCQTKRKSQAAAQQACGLHLVSRCWRNWRNALHRRWSEEEHSQAAHQLATRITKRRALQRWRAYVTLCRDEAEVSKVASQHRRHHLLSAGFQGLYLNVSWNKTRRMNNNMAMQHYQQTTMRTFWKLWQVRQEEAEDKSFLPLTEKAQTNYSSSLLSSCFQYWREKLAEQRHVQELERRADIWFAERMLPQCFNAWVEFTLQGRLNRQRRRRAEVFHLQRRHTWAFYTWLGRSEERKEEALSERTAILHEERYHMRRALACWRQRTEQQIREEEKRKASDHLYMRRLLQRTVAQWKDTSTDIRDRRNREHQARHRGDLLCVKWALEKWKKFAHSQRVKRLKLGEMRRYHESKLLKHTFAAWKTHHLQTSRVYGHAEQLYTQQTQHSLRVALSVWRENAVVQAEDRLAEQQARRHFERGLQSEVCRGWQRATARSVSKRRQQGEAVRLARGSISRACLLRTFRQWRKQTREARRERMCMERARRHHNSRLLSKALKGWNEYRCHFQKYKVMKRQGILLLRLKMYQTYFEQWKIKMQHRRGEVKQTEQALWHWSLSLQAKVLYGWRQWVTEQRRNREQAATAALVYRDQLLREGVTCILTYAAHMSDLTTSLADHSQERRSRRLQRVVRRCAVRWRQRALCRPQGEQPPKKSVSFCLTTDGPGDDCWSDSVEQEAGGGALGRLPTHMHRRQPRRCEELFESPVSALPRQCTQNQFATKGPEASPNLFSSPSQKKQATAVSCLLPAKVAVTSTRPSTVASTVSPAEPHPSIVDSSQETRNSDLLLPPSAFMNTVSRHPEPQTSASSEETAGPHAEGVRTDSASVLTRELLSIQLDMKSFQQERKRLRAWQKLKEVLQSWLQTSGEDELMEKKSVCQELNELEERIDSLSSDLTKRKPTMLRHAERIQHLQAVLHTSGVPALCRQATEMETDFSRSNVTGNRTGLHISPD